MCNCVCCHLVSVSLETGIVFLCKILKSIYGGNNMVALKLNTLYTPVQGKVSSVLMFVA